MWLVLVTTARNSEYVEYILANRKLFVDVCCFAVVCPKKDLYKFLHFEDIRLISDDMVVDSSKIGTYSYYLELKGISKSRSNWFYQQVLKISIARILNTEWLVIWDADTIPLKKIIHRKQQKFVLYHGHEFHKPYFQMLSLVGLDAYCSNKSFVSQHLITSRSICEELQELFKQLGPTSEWDINIILNAKSCEDSFFSEYEHLARLLIKNYSKEVIFISDRRWSRNGIPLVGSLDGLKDQTIILEPYDYLAFEYWHKPYSRYLSPRGIVQSFVQLVIHRALEIKLDLPLIRLCFIALYIYVCSVILKANYLRLMILAILMFSSRHHVRKVKGISRVTLCADWICNIELPSIIGIRWIATESVTDLFVSKELTSTEDVLIESAYIDDMHLHIEVRAQA